MRGDDIIENNERIVSFKGGYSHEKEGYFFLKSIDPTYIMDEKRHTYTRILLRHAVRMHPG
jgi:hypothetical protein